MTIGELYNWACAYGTVNFDLQVATPYGIYQVETERNVDVIADENGDRVVINNLD